MKNVKKIILLGLFLIKNTYLILSNKRPSSDYNNTKLHKDIVYFSEELNSKLFFKLNLDEKLTILIDFILEENDDINLFNNKFIDNIKKIILNNTTLFGISLGLNLEFVNFYKIYSFIERKKKNNFRLNMIFTINSKFKLNENDFILTNFIKNSIIEFPQGKCFEDFFSNDMNIEKLKNDIKENYYDLLKYD